MANILLIDDEPVLLDVVSNTLRLAGHDVTAMGNPLTALSASFAGGSPIDLVLTDIDTKPISGFEVVRRLSSRGFDGSVLFMSEYSSLASAVAQSLGESAVLEKPFTAAQLKTAVGRALRKARTRSIRQVEAALY
jgi:DNA-binding NtrC family response regulator